MVCKVLCCVVLCFRYICVWIYWVLSSLSLSLSLYIYIIYSAGWAQMSCLFFFSLYLCSLVVGVDSVLICIDCVTSLGKVKILGRSYLR